MKRVLLSTVAALAAAVCVSAQGLTATLQQGSSMTAFYGEDAFVNAYKAASNGATITLSAGEFNTVDSITKRVTIIGNGCENHDGTNSTYIRYKYIAHYGSSRYTSLIINANNVKIEGVRANNVYLRNVSNTHFSHCHIGFLYATNPHEGTLIDQSLVSWDYSLPKSVNSCYKNSLVYGFEIINSAANPAYFLNCWLYRFYDYYLAESGNPQSNYGTPYGVFRNCILGFRDYNYNNLSNTGSDYWKGFYLYTATQRSSNEYYNNVLYLYPYRYVKNASGNWTSEFSEEMADKGLLLLNWGTSQTIKGNRVSTWNSLVENRNNSWYKQLKSDLPLGDDGTVVGPYGGTGFSINPSIPRIVESQIDSNTDAAGRLNVKIKVEVNK